MKPLKIMDQCEYMGDEEIPGNYDKLYLRYNTHIHNYCFDIILHMYTQETNNANRYASYIPEMR